MGEQGGLRTGWLAAFGTEGYDGEPPLLEELGINFGHIRTKVGDYLVFLLIGSGLVAGDSGHWNSTLFHKDQSSQIAGDGNMEILLE